jgi:hypothetical protein
MSPSRWLVSLFVTWHVSAMVIGAIPTSDAFPLKVEVRHPSGNVLVATLTPLLDSIAEAAMPHVMALWRASLPARAIVDPYLQGLGFNERWTMFANPPANDDYVRIRFYVGSKGSDPRATRVVTQLIFPAHREDRVRLFQSFRDSYRDRAVATTLEHVHRGLFRAESPSPPSEAESREHYFPLARHFSRVFEQGLRPGERVIRTEIWHGTSENLPPGRAELARARRASLMFALAEYYAGPIEEVPLSGGYPRYFDSRTEDDIVWTMEYVDDPQLGAPTGS